MNNKCFILLFLDLKLLIKVSGEWSVQLKVMIATVRSVRPFDLKLLTIQTGDGPELYQRIYFILHTNVSFI